MARNPILGFAIGTGAAAGAAAAVRAWWPSQAKWADALGAAAGAVVGGAAYLVKGLRPYAIDIAAGAAISQAPRIVESVIGGGATTGLVSVERLSGLGLVQAQFSNQLSGAINGGNANVGSHFGSVPLAGAH
jgi:hypothetical protein